MRQKNARTRAFLSDFLAQNGLSCGPVEVQSTAIVGCGPKPSGRWHFNVKVGEGTQCSTALYFAVQLRPSSSKYMRILSVRPGDIYIPDELESSINDFGQKMRGQQRYEPKETTATQFRRVLEMMTPCCEIDPEIENDLKRQVIWIFQNPTVAATVAEQKNRWFYNNPNTGIFFITQTPEFFITQTPG